MQWCKRIKPSFSTTSRKRFNSTRKKIQWKNYRSFSLKDFCEIDKFHKKAQMITTETNKSYLSLLEVIKILSHPDKTGPGWQVNKTKYFLLSHVTDN